jgi:hypothetical protein
MINGIVFKDFGGFFSELEAIMEWLAPWPRRPRYLSWRKGSACRLRARMGKFRRGHPWIHADLKDLINEPTDLLLEKFLAQTPMPLISG